MKKGNTNTESQIRREEDEERKHNPKSQNSTLVLVKVNVEFWDFGLCFLSSSSSLLIWDSVLVFPFFIFFYVNYCTLLNVVFISLPCTHCSIKILIVLYDPLLLYILYVGMHFVMHIRDI